MRATRRLQRLALNSVSSTGSILALAAAAAPAAAQSGPAVPDRNFDADLFQAAIGPRNFLTVNAPEMPIHKQLSVGAFFDYQRNPYDVYSFNGNSNKPYS